MDQIRTIKHEALISELNILNRFIAFNFGKLDREVLEEWEEKEESHGRVVLRVERINLPENIIFPDYMNTKDRRQIMDWAIKISESITNLKNLCNKERR